MEPDAPIVFVHDDDAVLWAVSTTPAVEGWLVVRTDTDRPRVQELDNYICTSAHWHLAGHPGWALAATLQESGTWQLFLPGRTEPWTLHLNGPQRHLRPPMTDVPRDSTEALSWRLAAELARRHPRQLWVARTIPITGVDYDCLTLWRPGDRGTIGPPILQLNRGGTITIHHRFDGTPLDPWPRWRWTDYLAADPYRFTRKLEELAGLPSVDHVPATIATTLVWRIIAELVAHAPRSVHRIEALSGYDDVSGYAAPRDDLFEEFPEARRALQQSHPHDPEGEAHRRFWFICVDDQPRVALSTTGTGWMLANVEIDLMAAYDDADRRLGPVVAELLQDVID